MHGASQMQPEELEIGDEVRVVSEDGAITCTLVEANQEEGLTFDYPNSISQLVIAFLDLPDYDFYPRGKTIHRLKNKLEPIEIKTEVETLDWFGVNDDLLIEAGQDQYRGLIKEISSEMTGDLKSLDLNITRGKEEGATYNFDRALLARSTIYVMGDTEQKILDRIEGLTGQPEPQVDVSQDEQDFFVMYEQYNDLPPVDSQIALNLFEKMQMLTAKKKNRHLSEAIDFAVQERLAKIKNYEDVLETL